MFVGRKALSLSFWGSSLKLIEELVLCIRTFGPNIETQLNSLGYLVDAQKFNLFSLWITE